VLRLPRTAALEVFAKARALCDVDAFVAALPGAAVLVRLDERGGENEGAPWAFPSPPEIEVEGEGEVDGENVFFDPAYTADSDEATATGPAQPPLAIPAARDAATAFVVPATGGPVGRANSNVVRVAERSMSRKHAVLSVVDGHWQLTDLDSDNGSGVNGLLLVPGVAHALRSGDVVHFGDVSFVFLTAQALFSHLPALTGT
jgi:hypothetical protein